MNVADGKNKRGSTPEVLIGLRVNSLKTLQSEIVPMRGWAAHLSGYRSGKYHWLSYQVPPRVKDIDGTGKK